MRAGRAIIVALSAVLVAAAGMCGEAGGGDPPPPVERKVTDAERDAIGGLLKKFAEATEAGSEEAVAVLLSPELATDARTAILEAVAAEFDNRRYEEFKLVVDRHTVIVFVADDTVRLEPVLASYRYVSQESVDPSTDVGENAYIFTVQTVDGRWHLVDSNLFNTWTVVTAANFLSWIFFFTAVAVVVIFFWGWMVLDCSLRYRNWKYSAAVFFTFPVGPLYYFFAVWLRGPAGEISE